jgi:hypothetical protein
MSYYVICPSCNEKNIGGAFYCTKCQTHLVGIPHQEDLSSKNNISSIQNTVDGNQIISNEDKGGKVSAMLFGVFHEFL